MTITLNGTTGIVGPNGTASAPAMTGTDTDTGIVYGTNTVQVATGGTTAVTVDSSQNVGIGTSSPSYRLDTRASAGVGIQFLETSSGSTNRVQLGAGSGLGYINADAGSGSIALAMQVAGTERMRINSSGNLLVGLTTTSAVARVVIQKASGSADGLVILQDTGGSGITQGSSGSTGLFSYYYTTSGVCGTISGSGTSTTYATSSDYRLKENIAPMTGALAKVQSLKPVTYTWKHDGSASEGFIAHELAEVCPDAVVGEKDAVNEDGSIKAQGIDTSFLVATLTAAIQEQQAIITDLKARIETLENK